MRCDECVRECAGMLPWQTWLTHLCVFLCLEDKLQHAQLHTRETLQPLVSLFLFSTQIPPEMEATRSNCRL